MFDWFDFQWLYKHHQKLGIILEIKMFKKLKLSKNDNNKKCSSKLVFLNIFLFLLTANIFESGPMLTPWKFLDSLKVIPNCYLGQN